MSRGRIEQAFDDAPPVKIHRGGDMKKSKTLSRNEEGVVGIGALIIFTATILVGAVAAEVMIDISSTLQQKAEKMGSIEGQKVYHVRSKTVERVFRHIKQKHRTTRVFNKRFGKRDSRIHPNMHSTQLKANTENKKPNQGY
ncbi:MAG: hypothetical protein EMLJLAPB_00257 [Candidatus Argoarchaeum ethanivorans]|uniref:Uncharacterized protein n=1 Tax=Candidatus Argoarchaeum ethanivorans TaxID=2608793 RepID=A0A811TCM5_9EURY|nr:MAG: hypothetical protein EMLJLAPB_00257 [Candidatus Argoarchaeum ethanivorans]